MNNALIFKYKYIAKRLVLALTMTALVMPTMVYAKDGDEGKSKTGIMWINHFGLLSGNANELKVSANSNSSGIGSGLTGLVLQSGANGLPGDLFSDNSPKVVQTALDLPKNTQINRIRVCYENSSALSYITAVGLIQVQDPPSAGLVKLDDTTNLNAGGPVCVNSKAAKPPVKSKDGPVLLVLRVNLANASDKIVIRGLGLVVK